MYVICSTYILQYTIVRLLFDVHCSKYNKVHCTPYIELYCTSYNVQCTTYTVRRTVYHTTYSVCRMAYVHRTTYMYVICSTYILQYTIIRVLFDVQCRKYNKVHCKAYGQSWRTTPCIVRRRFSCCYCVKSRLDNKQFK